MTDLSMPLRDAIEIPEQTHTGDFVLKLDRGVDEAERTLAQYVVTPSIAESFDDALGLVRSTVRKNGSAGAFVHGSFGSGKSHFMAVLHLLLAGNAQAAALSGLQAVVSDFQDVIGKSFLLLDFHMIGKKSVEDAVFGGYLEAIRRRHPDAAPPVLHTSDELLQDAQRLRDAMGDERFFGAISAGDQTTAPAIEGLGSLGTLIGGQPWNAARFESALAEPADGIERTKLVQALTRTLFTSAVTTGEWLDMEAGLKAMTAHAKSLGYEGTILFLDELVLWLAGHITQTDVIQTESSKVAKLVETSSDLALPLVSFVARQRDLKDFLGGASSGAEQAAVGDSFRWWEDRFDRIELKAADLPKIINQRLLQPKDERGRAALAAGLERVKRDTSAFSDLLKDEANSSETDFALVYPFSPALVDAMIALSALMQRERTALTIMSELLVKGRNTLTVSDVIGVGRLFDAVVLEGTKPLTPEMRQRFAVAESFYTARFRPYLLDKHTLTEDQLSSGEKSLPAEDLVMKTLLVAFIAPGTRSLENMSAARLASLNYGSVTSMVPGRQAQQVATWARDWSKNFGDVIVGEGNNPIITLQLSGVDYESVIGRVENEDTPGNRRKLISDLMIHELGLGANQGFDAVRHLTHIWRGSRRDVDVVFGNVRDTALVPSDILRAQNGKWRVVVDHPFDEAGHSRNDDFLRIQNEREAGIESNTIVWVPYFLTANRMNDVGRLVLLEYLAPPNVFEANAGHLSPNDREPARQALENQRRSLRENVINVLRQAYGTATPSSSDIDHDDRTVFDTLMGMTIRPQIGATLREGLEKALDIALSNEYPDHPRFEPSESEVRRSELTKVLERVRETVANGGRIDGLDSATAKLMRRVTGPIGIGETRENVYAIRPETFRWNPEFTRAEAESTSPDGVRAGELRKRLAEYGMTRDVEDLVILSWAALADREIRAYSAPAGEIAIGGLKDEMSFRQPQLPTEEHWSTATARAQAIFGIPPEYHLSAAALNRTGGRLIAKARQSQADASSLESTLYMHREILGLADGSPRMVTATRARELLESLAKATSELDAVELLATADLPAETQALGKSIASAGDVSRSLQTARWTLFEAMPTYESKGGLDVRDALRSAAVQEELHKPLGDELVRLGNLAETIVVVPKLPQSSDSDSTQVALDDIEIDLGEGKTRRFGEVKRQLDTFVRTNKGKRIRVSWEIVE